MRAHGASGVPAIMLKVTVSIVPGGHGAERQLGHLLIKNVGGGSLSDYELELTADDLPAALHGRLRAYPRWSAAIWDLVARALAIALNGRERLPRRPESVLKKVPIHESGRLRYVRVDDIPEPARSAFERSMSHSTVPVIPGEERCAYIWDWTDFVNGLRS